MNYPNLIKQLEELVKKYPITDFEVDLRLEQELNILVSQIDFEGLKLDKNDVLNDLRYDMNQIRRMNDYNTIMSKRIEDIDFCIPRPLKK